ncbi:MAG: iron-containing alcohol dehydrogenase [Waltera sp.]
MNSFVYDIPVKVYFGENQLSHLGEELSRYGKRVLLTYGGGSIKKTGLYDAVASKSKKPDWSFMNCPVLHQIRGLSQCGKGWRSVREKTLM